MSRCDANDLNPNAPRKFRGRAAIRRGRADQIIVYKWPRKRSKPRKPITQAWIDDFADKARNILPVDACTFDLANAYAKAPCSGYTFWRDHLSTAAAGKLVSEAPDRHAPDSSTLVGAIFRVTTPTASVFGTVTTALVSGSFTNLRIDEQDWDNANFWNSETKPNTLRFQQSGLYWVSLAIEFGANVGTMRMVRIRINGVSTRFYTQVTQHAASIIQVGLDFIWPFTKDDVINAVAVTNTNGQTAITRKFQVLAITPESVI